MGTCLSTEAAVVGGKKTGHAHDSQSIHHQPTTASSHSGETVASAKHEQGKQSIENPKVLPRARRSPVGLDTMVEERKLDGHLWTNVVVIESVCGRHIEEVYNGVHDGKELGEGAAGLVRLVTHKATGIEYAVKCLELARVGESEEAHQQLRNEITIMSQLDHPNIARLQEVYEDDDHIYLVQELGEGGELFDVMDELPDYHYSESDAARLVYQMLSALRYLHSKGIIHRDLKLENFLFATQRRSQLKMIDFGLSKHFNSGEVQHEVVGTPYTVAPEVISGNYDEKCDIWGIGVLAFMLLCGETPFGGCGGPETLTQIKANIRSGRYKFQPAYVWANISPEAKDFVQKLLVTDPNLRPSAENAQHHPWIRASHEQRIHEETLSPNIVDALVAFKNLPVAKRLMFEVLSFTMLPDQIRHLHFEFEKMDTDGLGEISLDCMNQVLTRRSEGHEALTETEIKDIFDAMKVGKSEPRIHWHEFIAACLPECQVEDGNLRSAFDRLDQDHNGFISFEGVVRLIARDANENEDALKKTWAESVKECHCKRSRFNFEEFSDLVHRCL